MYSLGARVITTTDSLLSSLTSTEGMFTAPTSNSIFACPLTIQLNFSCAFCENAFEIGTGKARDMKQLEDVALEYFKRRVLRAEEESFGDVSVFPDDADGSHYKKLLSSITLCDGCITHCAKNEERILRDQLTFLDKMNGSKTLEEVFADPWLDVKRVAFYNLKCQESTIKDKLALLEKLLTSDSVNNTSTKCAAPQNENPVSSSPVEVIASTSTSNNNEKPSTSAGQILAVSLNFPATSQSDSSNNVRNADDDDDNEQMVISTSGTNAPETGSKLSSRIGSPKQDENDLDESASKNISATYEEKAEAPVTSDQLPNQHKLKDANKPSTSSKVRERRSSTKSNLERDDDGGNVSDAESAVSIRSIRKAIPAIHMSPVVRLKPLSPSKTPLQQHSSSKTDTKNIDPASATKVPPVKKLNLDEIVVVLDENDTSNENTNANVSQTISDDDQVSNENDSLSQEEKIEDDDQVSNENDSLSQEAKIVDDDQVSNENDSLSQEGQIDNGDQVENHAQEETSEQNDNKKNANVESDDDDDDDFVDVVRPNKTIESQPENETKIASVNATKINKKKRGKKSPVVESTTDEEDLKKNESSQELFEDSNSPEKNGDRDKSFVKPAVKNIKKRKLWNDNDGGENKKRVKSPTDFGHASKVLPSYKATETPPSSSTLKGTVDPTSAIVASNFLKRAAMRRFTPLSASKPIRVKKSSSSEPFVTPMKGGKSPVVNKKKGSGSGAKKSKRLSVIDLAKEKLGAEMFKQIRTPSPCNTLWKKPSESPSPIAKPKKVFKIGNRYMTDPSSSEDSDDSD